ncbi:MAG: 50S ribosomal protein L24 [Lentisphaerae bacterium]|jgi:large subunit ribosomal protein L24|nr:50S ribosomal protein L24 [Lentisphaerota bacterium]
MSKAKIKKDMTVRVIAGADRGKVGKVLKVDRKAERVCVEGVAIRKKTIRRSQTHPNGGIEEVEAMIHISNVMSEDRWQARAEARKARSGGGQG